MLLGIASSIGLGTGLHTFVLYLGPHIAKITLASQDCGFVPTMLPNRYAFQTFAPCEPTGKEVLFMDIFWAVELEALFWGIGTAIGELPPYFVARAAKAAGEKVAELESGNAGLEKCKAIILKFLQKFGFVAITIFASIPNPLFDLAGLTCGYFGIGFWTFLFATGIGKAGCKAHLQVAFTILLFNKGKCEQLLKWLEDKMPYLQGWFSQQMDSQKKRLFEQSPPSTWLNTIWNSLIILMVLGFCVSIINSLVRAKLKESKKTEAKSS